MTSSYPSDIIGLKVIYRSINILLFNQINFESGNLYKRGLKAHGYTKPATITIFLTFRVTGI